MEALTVHSAGSIEIRGSFNLRTIPFGPALAPQHIAENAFKAAWHKATGHVSPFVPFPSGNSSNYDEAMDLQGKTVLVTGASSGIGKAIAIAFARKRAHVFVYYRRNEAGAQDTLREVTKVSGGQLCQADLMDPDAIKCLFDEIKRTTSTLDVLVNNAGEVQPGDLSADSVWEYEYKNIFLSAMRTSAEFISMPSSHLRKIINVTSIFGNLATGDPEYLQYSAFKAALASVTATLSKSAAPHMLVNAVAPGYTETPAWVGASTESKDACARTTLIGRFVRPEEVAHAAIFIAENDALAGQVLTLDGGTSLKGMA